MCLQQTHQTMMTDETMMTNEMHETVLMLMNHTNTTAEEIETISVHSSSAPFFKMDEQFDPVDYAVTFSSSLRAPPGVMPRGLQRCREASRARAPRLRLLGRVCRAVIRRSI